MKRRFLAILTASVLVLGIAGVSSAAAADNITPQKELPNAY
ncbi:hypothetical protein [Rossellomorea sp. KS-H15a]|nr:hypothetical protein [Rossellomorea sp. KS-H15a]